MPFVGLREQQHNVDDAVEKLQCYIDTVEDTPVEHKTVVKKETFHGKEVRIREKKRKGEFLRRKTHVMDDD